MGSCVDGGKGADRRRATLPRHDLRMIGEVSGDYKPSNVLEIAIDFSPINQCDRYTNLILANQSNLDIVLYPF